MISWVLLKAPSLRGFPGEFEEDVFGIDLDHSINQRNVMGGTALVQVQNAIINAKNLTQNKINEYKKY